jgi:hypothetical protein
MTKPIPLIRFTIQLEPEDYLKAARLGGLSIPFHTSLIHSPEYPSDMMMPYVHAGILSAIGTGFDRTYPPRYPDDYDPSSWQMNSEPYKGDYIFPNHWTGDVQW